MFRERKLGQRCAKYTGKAAEIAANILLENNGFSEKITIDGSAAIKAAIEEFNSDNDMT